MGLFRKYPRALADRSELVVCNPELLRVRFIHRGDTLRIFFALDKSDRHELRIQFIIDDMPEETKPAKNLAVFIEPARNIVRLNLDISTNMFTIGGWDEWVAYTFWPEEMLDDMSDFFAIIELPQLQNVTVKRCEIEAPRFVQWMQKHKSTLRKASLNEIYLGRCASGPGGSESAWKRSIKELATCMELESVECREVLDLGIMKRLRPEELLYDFGRRAERHDRHVEYSNSVPTYLLSRGAKSYPTYDRLWLLDDTTDLSES